MHPDDGGIVRLRNGGKYEKIRPGFTSQKCYILFSNLLNFVFVFIPLNALLVDIFGEDDTIPLTNASAKM